MRRKPDQHDTSLSASSLYLRSHLLQDRDSGYTEPESDLDTTPSRGAYPFSDDEDLTIKKGFILETTPTHSLSSLQPLVGSLDSTSYHIYQADKAIESVRHYAFEKDWKKVLKHKSGVIVYMLQKQGINDKLTIFKGESVIQGFTPQSVFYVIGMRKLWDDQFEDGNLLQNLNDTTSITYETYQSSGSTKAYDLTLVEKIDCSNDGVIMFACTSVETSKVAKQPGRTRNHVKLHGWILKLLPTTPPSTHVTFITEEIVRGWIPGLTKKSLARKPLIIASVDHYLKHKAQSSIPNTKKEQQSKPISKFLGPLSAYTRRRPSIMTSQVSSPPVLINPPPRHSSLNSQQTASSLTKRITFGADVIIPLPSDNNSSPIKDPEPSHSRSTGSNLYPIQRHRTARKESLTNYKRLLSSDMDEWNLVEEKEGVQIYYKAVQGSTLPILRGNGLIEGSWTAEQVCSVVQCFGARTKWDESFEGGEIVERFSQKEYLVSMRMKSLFPINSRDFVLLTHIESEGRSETIHVVSTSVSDSLLPETASYTRGRILVSGWTFQGVKNEQGQCIGVKVTTISHLDLAGTTPLPSVIIRLLTHQIPYSVLQVRHYLERGCPPYIRRVAGKVLSETFDPDARVYKMAYTVKHLASGRRQRSEQSWCTDIRIHSSVYTDSFEVVARPEQHVSVVRQVDGIRIYTLHEDMDGTVVEIDVLPVLPPPIGKDPMVLAHPLESYNEQHLVGDTEIKDMDTSDLVVDSTDLTVNTPDLNFPTRQRSNSIIVIGDQLSFNGPQISIIFVLMVLSYYVGKVSCRC